MLQCVTNTPLPGGPLPLCGPQTVVDEVDPAAVGPALLPALGQVRGAGDHVAQRVHHGVVGARAVAVTGQQGDHDLGGVKESWEGPCKS